MRRTFTVRMGGITVGWTSLEHRDAGAGVARGAFRPGPGYELVEPIFRLYAEAQGGKPAGPADETKLARYHAARDRLGLTLHAPKGDVVATRALHVADFRAERGPHAIELEVSAADPAAWAVIAERG